MPGRPPTRGYTETGHRGRAKGLRDSVALDRFLAHFRDEAEEGMSLPGVGRGGQGSHRTYF